jgi:2-dehydro-3-deoxyphosphogluconate aldolase/(4S)-4-hydroxy-2-oxoglutarate aldolase
MLKAISGPFPQITFCPTGGITLDNYRDYLALGNVACIGGSWIAPQGAMDQGDWARITALTREAVERSGRSAG